MDWEGLDVWRCGGVELVVVVEVGVGFDLFGGWVGVVGERGEGKMGEEREGGRKMESRMGGSG